MASRTYTTVAENVQSLDQSSGGMIRGVPSREPTIASDWTVLALRALTWGVLGALLLFALAASLIAAFGWPFELWLLPAWFVALVAITAFAWATESGWAKGTLYGWEQETGIDLNRDGTIGQPQSLPVLVNAYQPHPVIVGAHEPTPAANAQTAEDAWWSTVEWFVATCWRLDPRAEKEVAGRTKPDGTRLTQAEYDGLRDMLIKANFAGWNNEHHHNQGWHWNRGLKSASEILAQLQMLKRDNGGAEPW